MLWKAPTLLRLSCTAWRTSPLSHFQRHFASSLVKIDRSTRESDAPKVATAPPDKVSTDKEKTVAQLDEELRRKMSGIAGDGGEAGIEYEDGKPVSMKRSVKNNMFRYI
ncbi:hypothetical protein GGR57DRAFT_232728 [Xylariaceae sp. FL1272]|nr:hypothetical protein GGR57DRAFT_232728 [Xylariaceae sp. FL1272]